MLFLFSFRLQFIVILLNCFFLNSSSASNTSDDVTFYSRITNANQEIIYQNSNFLTVLILGILLIIVLLFYIGFYLYRTKRMGIVNATILNKKVFDMNNRIKKQDDCLLLYDELFMSLDLRINHIKKLLNEAYNYLSIETELKKRVGAISKFANDTALLTSKSISIIEKLR